jgi:hypothetical protein
VARDDLPVAYYRPDLAGANGEDCALRWIDDGVKLPDAEHPQI